VDLDRIGDAASQRAGQDHRAHHQVVREGPVRLDRRDDVANGGGVCRDVMFDLTVCQLRKGARVESLVVIGHIDRQEAADVREVSSTADRTARDLDVQPPVTPAADGIHEIEFRRVPFLAQQMYLVAEIDQPPGQLRIVDITSCAPQEVAMEYQNAHSHHVSRNQCPASRAVMDSCPGWGETSRKDPNLIVRIC
jgi:hypothetical protein